MAKNNGFRDVLSAKDQRMLEACRLRYMENKSPAEIAEELDVETGTVNNYFSSDEIEDFKRYFSDKKLYELQQQLEQDLFDAYQESKQMLSSAQQEADSSRAYTQAAKARMEIANKKLAMLQELGIIDKPGVERDSQDEEEEATQVEFNLDESVQEKIEEKKEEKALP